MNVLQMICLLMICFHITMPKHCLQLTFLLSRQQALKRMRTLRRKAIHILKAAKARAVRVIAARVMTARAKAAATVVVVATVAAVAHILLKNVSNPLPLY